MGNKIAVNVKKDTQVCEQTPKKLGRGEHSNEEELRKWHSALSFTDLDKRGQEAFFKYLRGNFYTEDEDITSVSIKADGMEGHAKRYQFWIKCEALELDKLFDVYVMDEETKLRDVNTNDDDVIKFKTEAHSVDSYVRTLKDRMKPDLDFQFSEFKSYLDETFLKS
ncbi:uncharacterized protein [Palaemon carinicauda]|uniref:uncharacterized protein isoform X2 n=1 Tax=Palaemon carinicauda TaxID=392227 RepID=UPI0035B67DEB